MKSLVQRSAVAASVFVMSALPVLAQQETTYSFWQNSSWQHWYPRPVAVPEIDASMGLLAMAAVCAAMLFVWERRRRQA